MKQATEKLSRVERAEEMLRQSEKKYRDLVETSQNLIWSLDAEGRCTFVNRKAVQEIFGYPAEEVVGRPFTDFGAPEHAARDIEVFQRLMAGEPVFHYESVQLRQDGSRVQLCYNALPLFDDAGRVIGATGTAIDITQRKQAEQELELQLRHVQKMDAVGQLAGGMAHDFNNLLTAILANLSLVRSGSLDAPYVREAIESAEQATIRAAELTRTLLGFARRTPLQTAPLSLADVLHATLRLVRPALPPDIVLEVDVPADLWLIDADLAQLEQVLMNLTLNARDAMPQGGRVRYEAAPFVPSAVYLGSHVEARRGDFVRLRVADTGHGMPPEVRQHIFEPFYTTKPRGQGTGLGLATAFSIVKQHNGWIECRSEPGRGTAFDIYLPRSMRSPAVAAAPAGAAAGLRGHETILVVDDEAAVRTAAKNILTQAGYQVLLAADGARALDIYRVLRDRIHLVVLDSVMPNLSGRETLETLARLNPQVRVLFSTGYCNDQQAVQAVPQVCGYLPKPYRAEELTAKVRQVLDV